MVAKSFTDIVEKCFWLLSEFHERAYARVKRKYEFFVGYQIFIFLSGLLLKLLLSSVINKY